MKKKQIARKNPEKEMKNVFNPQVALLWFILGLVYLDLRVDHPLLFKFLGDDGDGGATSGSEEQNDQRSMAIMNAFTHYHNVELMSNTFFSHALTILIAAGMWPIISDALKQRTRLNMFILLMALIMAYIFGFIIIKERLNLEQYYDNIHLHSEQLLTLPHLRIIGWAHVALVPLIFIALIALSYKPDADAAAIGMATVESKSKSKSKKEK